MSQHEPEATPQQQEAVRRLLAGARHDEPLPVDVGARLDAVLAQLAAEGPRAVDPPPHAVVVDLAARRRRRVTGLLGAAAAVVVLGVGVSQVVDRGGSDSGDDSAGPAAAGGDSDVQAEEAPTDDRESSPAEGPTQPGQPAQPSAVPAPVGPRPDEVVAIDSPAFQESVLRLRYADAVTSVSPEAVLSAADLTTDPLFVCPATRLGAGRLLPVTYGGSPAVLAYRPATGETQVVDLLQCGSGDVVRSVSVPTS